MREREQPGVERLQRLYAEWTEYKARRNMALRRLLVKPPLPKGVYLWGGDARTAAAEFARTVSRLTEMQSAAYLQSEKPNR